MYIVRAEEINDHPLRVEGSDTMFYLFTGDNMCVFSGEKSEIRSAKIGDEFTAQRMGGMLYLTKNNDDVYEIINEVFERDIDIFHDSYAFSIIEPREGSTKIHHSDALKYLEDGSSGYLYIYPLLEMKTFKSALQQMTTNGKADNLPEEGIFKDYMPEHIKKSVRIHPIIYMITIGDVQDELINLGHTV